MTLGQHGAYNNKPLEAVVQMAGLGPDSDQAHWAISEIKCFLDSYWKWVHSLVLFGSYALEAALEAFTRWVVWQYYRCAVDLKREMVADHGPDGLCTKNGKCMGHFSGDILARVISRMLYVTLPKRGFLPLCKPEAVAMASEVYGRGACRPVALAMDVLRKERAITYQEFRVMFPFARTLFRECIRICGPKNPKVIKALRLNADMYKRLRRRKR